MARVWHQKRSPWVHVDVHVVAPTPALNAFLLVTSGMSERPMAAPEGSQDLRYGELVMALPSSWPLLEGGDASALWPLRLLQDLAEPPHPHGFKLEAVCHHDRD